MAPDPPPPPSFRPLGILLLILAAIGALMALALSDVWGRFFRIQ